MLQQKVKELQDEKQCDEIQIMEQAEKLMEND